MDLGIRDWMIIVGLLLIVAVLFDGFRRMRNDRRGKIRMSLNKNFVNSSGELEEGFSTELPGGPRVVRRGDELLDVPCDDERDDLHLDESVPMLMESISAVEEVDGEVFSEASDDLSFSSIEGADLKVSESEVADIELSEVNDELSSDEVLGLSKPVQHELPVFENDEVVSTEQKSPVNSASQEVIIVNVMAKGEPFKGADLLHILLACDCRFGEMNIFHRYENSSGKGPVQFSIVNSVEPGSFELDNIDDFSTPGVCFFVTIPGPHKPIQAFDYMVETAQCLVKNLNGELRDETHSVMTSQTLEHCRQRIRDIERKQLTHV